VSPTEVLPTANGRPLEARIGFASVRQTPVEGRLQAVRSRGVANYRTELQEPTQSRLRTNQFSKTKWLSLGLSCGEPVGGLCPCRVLLPPALPLPFGRRGANFSRDPYCLSTRFLGPSLLFEGLFRGNGPSDSCRSTPARLLREPHTFRRRGRSILVVLRSWSRSFLLDDRPAVARRESLAGGAPRAAAARAGRHR